MGLYRKNPRPALDPERANAFGQGSGFVGSGTDTDLPATACVRGLPQGRVNYNQQSASLKYELQFTHSPVVATV